MAHLFTYGSLMFPAVWQHVVGSRHQAVPARLADYARYPVRGAGYPGIVAEAGATVAGVLYLDLGPENLAALDRFEGPEYARRTVAVDCEDGPRTAQTYLFLDRSGLDGGAWEPEAFDLAAFVARHCMR